MDDYLYLIFLIVIGLTLEVCLAIMIGKFIKAGDR